MKEARRIGFARLSNGSEEDVLNKKMLICRLILLTEELLDKRLSSLEFVVNKNSKEFNRAEKDVISCQRKVHDVVCGMNSRYVKSDNTVQDAVTSYIRFLKLKNGQSVSRTRPNVNDKTMGPSRSRSIIGDSVKTSQNPMLPPQRVKLSSRVPKIENEAGQKPTNLKSLTKSDSSKLMKTNIERKPSVPKFSKVTTPSRQGMILISKETQKKSVLSSSVWKSTENNTSKEAMVSSAQNQCGARGIETDNILSRRDNKENISYNNMYEDDKSSNRNQYTVNLQEDSNIIRLTSDDRSSIANNRTNLIGVDIQALYNNYTSSVHTFNNINLHNDENIQVDVCLSSSHEAEARGMSEREESVKRDTIGGEKEALKASSILNRFERDVDLKNILDNMNHILSSK